METPDQKPPETTEALGVHIVYISKAISEIKTTLKEIQTDAVGRVEFDEHVLWGQEVVKDHENRIVSLEECKMINDHSIWSKIKNAITEKAVSIIVLLIFIIFIITMIKLGQNGLIQLL